MKGAIGKDGSLFIERAGVMKRQMCPFVEIEACCGDDCSLFGEPFKHTDVLGRVTKLSICNQKTLYFDHFTDERSK